ncbi:4'-phosphopantetheinyl transferase family protein [Hyphomicrobium facile]|uniref:4'-phosphopantetheinyl transferase family protein n=1 Tax=Hyphomicrobium facile TaxID=51670 RepID=UPI000B8773A1|nr:4'-phosphopantetheinyl transferase superfamily protein [Hyphomicrobium facile]
MARLFSFPGKLTQGPPARGAEVEISVNAFEAEHDFPGVRIWYVPHATASNLTEHFGTLAQADIDEFASIRNVEMRRRSLATRAVLRKALTESVGGRTAAHEWSFKRSAWGKPTLSNNAGSLNFSCSHTRLASVVAVSTCGPVGIDIENAIVDTNDTWLSDVFTTDEQTALKSMAVGERETAVSRLWALKEAYLKMLGTGIAEASTVAFDLRNDRLWSGHPNPQGEPVTFRTWIAKCQGHRLSVAVAMGGRKERGSWRQPLEEARVSIRTKLAFAGNWANKRAAAPPPLFRIPSAAAA